MIESLAVGTPVLTFAEGAAPEIVDEGVTGFICHDEADMAARLGSIGTLDRHACRVAAVTRFSTRRMVDDHVALYRQLLDDRSPSWSNQWPGRLLVAP
jgi:glycosyltransferase involved in cell wall biosynthesis